jgi:peptidoglycan/LPS O-acetylase OafA/YrhL
MERLQPVTSPASHARLVRLDGLRGVLAVYVMLGHAAPFIAWPSWLGRIIEAVVSHGLAAVDLFFALSGLVIVQSMARFQGRALPFLRARAKRLLAVYFIVLSGAVVSLAARSPFESMPWLHPGDSAHQIWEMGLPRPLLAYVVLHAALLQGVMPHDVLPDAEFALLGPAWSLSTEWQFYIVIAMLIGWVGRTNDGLVRLVVLFLGLAVGGRLYAAMAPAELRFHRAFLANEAAYFAIGIATARLWQGDGRRLFAAAIAVAMMIGASHAQGFAMVGKAAPPLIWVVAVMAQRTPDRRGIAPIARVLAHPAVLWLGAISYPLYLVNEPVGRGLAVVIGRAVQGDAVWFALLWGPLTLVVSLAVAFLLHRSVERPMMRRSSRPFRTPVAVPAAGPSPPDPAVG